MDEESKDLLTSCYALLLMIQMSSHTENKRIEELTEQIRIKIGFPKYEWIKQGGSHA